jgi:hypothetical protein
LAPAGRVDLGKKLFDRDGGVRCPRRAEGVESVLGDGSSASTTGCRLTSRSRAAKLRACSTGIYESLVPCSKKNSGASAPTQVIGELDR